MKTKITNRFNVLTLMLFCSLALFAACKKGKREEPVTPYIYHPTSLLGNTWSAQPHVDGIDDLLNFSSREDFTLSIYSYQAGNRYTNWVTGKYKVDGDSLTLTITERRTSVNDGMPTVTAVNEKLFDKATFIIKDDHLTINYLSYPADAPVATTATYIYIPRVL